MEKIFPYRVQIQFQPLSQRLGEMLWARFGPISMWYVLHAPVPRCRVTLPSCTFQGVHQSWLSVNLLISFTKLAAHQNVSPQTANPSVSRTTGPVINMFYPRSPEGTVVSVTDQQCSDVQTCSLHLMIDFVPHHTVPVGFLCIR